MSNIPKGWIKKDNTLVLSLKLPDFMRAMALLNSIGDIAQQLNHHPDMLIHNYSELKNATTTHSTKKKKKKDYELAQKVTDLLEYQEEKEQINTHGRS